MLNGGYWNSVLCQVPRSNSTAECQGLKTVARFVAFCGKFMSGTVQSVAFRCQILPQSWHSAVYWRVVVGIPQYVWTWNAKGLRRSRGLWHSADIWARNLAKDWIPVPPILHRQLPCLLRPNFLTHLTQDYPAVKPWRGKLFRPKLSTQGLIWNSISWHYTFKFTVPVQLGCCWCTTETSASDQCCRSKSFFGYGFRSTNYFFLS
jgi:hypothetical protein